MGKEVIKSSTLEILGKNIKQIRLLKGLSQENLASDLQKSINFISLVENGKTGLSIQTLVDICTALKVDTNTLFSDIITQNEIHTDAFISNSLNLFGEKDKAMVTELITYIIDSKR